MKRIARDSERAFTLIEVLVVVAIIALLVSILIPTLKKAKQQAHRAVCAAHMHQVAFAIFSYGNDNLGDGPRRGWFTYTVAESPHEALGWGGNYGVPHVRTNLGLLWPKWIGREQKTLYCPRLWGDIMVAPNSGWPGVFKLVSPDCYFVFGGYNYGVVLDKRGTTNGKPHPGLSPNLKGTNPFPPERWNPAFVDWLEDVWQPKNPNVKFKMPTTACLASDWWIGGMKPPHETGVNVSYTDGHVRYHFTKGLAVTSGNINQYEQWWNFTLKQ